MATSNTLNSFVAWVDPVIITTAPTLLLEKNTSRVRYVVQNTDGIVYVKLGYGCSLISFSYRLASNAVLEDFFQGPVTACTSSGTGICLVTEEV